MAAASLTVTTLRGEIRKFGGNRSNVRAWKSAYEQMTLQEFLTRHPNCNEFDFHTMELYAKYNKS